MLTQGGPDKAQELRDPVLSLSDELVFQNFNLVLRKALDDNALLNSVMLTYVFVATSSLNGDCLAYQNEALGSIRKSINIIDRATSESTLGAILLLAGIEVCTPLYVGEIRGGPDDKGSTGNAATGPASYGRNRTAP